jgi:transcriptional regulator with XRE-family HTH domain
MRFSVWFSTQEGLTQEAFAKSVGVTQGRIAQILTGDMPSMALAFEIMKATGGAVTPNDFIAVPAPRRSTETAASR